MGKTIIFQSLKQKIQPLKKTIFVNKVKRSSKLQQPIENLRPINKRRCEREVNEYAALLWMMAEKEISLGQFRLELE